ncbi:MAG: hypothetical protein AAFY72_17275, partial [Cyanobacteria bacterium J06649_4]
IFLVGLLSHPLASAQAQVADNVLPDINNTATAAYTTPSGAVDVLSNDIQVSTGVPLIDPAGNLLGCDGQPLDNYAGFSMALYEPDASGLDLGPLVALTAPDATQSIPPNVDNDNPFSFLPNEGRYNFLLDSRELLSTGLAQTAEGATYLLVIAPPADSEFLERRVRIELIAPLLNTSGDIVALRYEATSLDGQPISVDGAMEVTRSVRIDNAEQQTLTFLEFGLDAAICEANQIKITKSADRSAAQPGDVVVYRLNVRNLSGVAIDSIEVFDTPPIGFELITEAVSAEVGGVPVNVTATPSGNSIRFNSDVTLASDDVLDIIYALRVTPDAVRGSGRNSATVSAEREDNDFRIDDGPSSHSLTLDPGILSDCGTLIGRVFEDKNFDGEQQPGEAGIPNAVIFLDDGNRVVTDADGLFSVQKMLPGRRTGTLDLSSLPGYTLAANTHFIERNSHSRLVNLAPGGLVRMNFGVTPTFQEVQG